VPFSPDSSHIVVALWSLAVVVGHRSLPRLMPSCVIREPVVGSRVRAGWESDPHWAREFTTNMKTTAATATIIVTTATYNRSWHPIGFLVGAE
jgi:hypothetical protein